MNPQIITLEKYYSHQLEISTYRVAWNFIITLHNVDALEVHHIPRVFNAIRNYLKSKDDLWQQS